MLELDLEWTSFLHTHIAYSKSEGGPLWLVLGTDAEGDLLYEALLNSGSGWVRYADGFNTLDAAMLFCEIELREENWTPY